MRPYLEEIQRIEVDLEPYQEQMARIEDQMNDMEIFVEPGTLEEIEQQIHSQLEEIHRQIGEVHVNMEPLHEQLEAIHLQMEPLHEEMARLHREMEPIHERMEEIQRGMEPLHEEMELLGKRLDDALRVEVAGRLRAQLGPVTGPEAPFNEAAAHILERSTVRIDGDTVTIIGSATENGRILTDLLGPHRIGASQNFDNAVRSASAEMSQLEIRAD
jgi:DNA repair exonuclease SbcCD ATPase subunit